MGLKEWILIVAIVVALAFSIPSIIATNKSIKEIEKHFERGRVKKNVIYVGGKNMGLQEMKSIDNSLKSIARSLNTLVEVTKANKELKQELQDSLTGLELSIKEMKDNPLGLNERN